MVGREDLIKRMIYSPDTGEFRWRYTTRNFKKGEVAGFENDAGYVLLSIGGKVIRAHRAAWLYCFGRLPKNQIDHINGVRNDNRLCNLREVTNRENQMNRSCVQSNNKHGYVGVYWDKRRKKWYAWIKAEGKSKSLGRYREWHDAMYARYYGQLDYGYHERHGVSG